MLQKITRGFVKKIVSANSRSPTGASASPLSAADDRYLALAFAEARAVKGKTLPNPAVGAVLVKNGRVIGRGGTGPAGQAHAEIKALEAARRAKPDGAAGATAYVTLEPCDHFGRTPPCSRALIAAGVTRVVAACPDPNPKVAGRGFARLRRAGIAVTIAPRGSVWRREAEEFYGGFFFWIRHGRPRIVVKIAQSADGRINAAPGEETPLTGLPARRVAHGLRARADAILVGGATVRADDPDLTPRLAPAAPGTTAGKTRRGPPPEVVVLTRGGRIDRDLAVFAPGRRAATRIMAPRKPSNCPEWVDFMPLPASSGRRKDAAVSARALLKALASRGYHEILVEGGRAVWTPFLEAGLCDELYVFTAPVLLPRGEAWAKELGPAWVKPLVFHRFTPLGRDSLTEFRRRVS